MRPDPIAVRTALLALAWFLGMSGGLWALHVLSNP